MSVPTISLNVQFYPGNFDAFAKSKTFPGTNKPSAAIITAVEPDSVSVTVFPDGRQPVTRQNVKYYTEDGEPRFKYIEDPELERFWQGDAAVFPDPIDGINLFFTGELATGTIVFNDQALTSPYVARAFLMDQNTATVYEVNQVTGELTEYIEA